MAKKKRLMGRNALDKARALRKLGVPITSIHEALDLADFWSYKTTHSLLVADDAHVEATRPTWLKAEPSVQSPPTNWYFDGVFPLGTWRVRAVEPQDS